MVYFLSKLLPLFVYPLGIAIILSLFTCLLVWTGRRRAAVTVLLLSVSLLWITSTRKAAEFVMWSLERHYPPIAVQDMPSAEAIVILGGTTRGIVPGTGMPDLDDGVDRIIHGARLFKAGKAPIILLSGGGMPGYPSEAERMAELLRLMDIPAESLVPETESRNTRENGIKTQRILEQQGIRKVLLVTSAYHMRRAQAIFAELGIASIPAATDYRLVERPPSPLDWLPHGGNQKMITTGIKEYIGFWVYSLMSAVRRF